MEVVYQQVTINQPAADAGLFSSRPPARQRLVRHVIGRTPKCEN